MGALKRTVLLLALISMIGCGGRAAQPVAKTQLGDDQMSCQELKAEMAHAEAQVQALIPESKKTGKNVALGAAGVFLIFPWFFMDMSDAERTEIKAYQDRYLELEKLYKRNGCDTAPGVTTAGSQLAQDSGPKARLEVLDGLKRDGLISEDEYQSRRKEILDSL